MLITEFKIRPSKSARLYYNVKIFDTVSAMQKYAKFERPKALRYPGTKDYSGLCTTWTLQDKNGMTPNCGEVLLAKGSLSPRIVVHEISHAMFGLKRRKAVGDLSIDENGKVNSKPEEWAVDAVAQMTCKVYGEINRLGLQ